MKTMRTFTLRLGDLVVPVDLVSAVSEPRSGFRRLHGADGCEQPIKLVVACPEHGVLEDGADVPAYELAKGQYVRLTDTELDALRPPDSSSLELHGFVDVGELDPLLVSKRYHLAASRTKIGQAAYRTLAETMHDRQVAAIVRFGAWNSEQLGAISSRGPVLELATLHFLEDLVDAAEAHTRVADVDVLDVDRELMGEIVDRYTRKLRPDDLASQQRPRVRALVEAKKNSGARIVEPDLDNQPAPAAAATADLTSALRSTLKSAPRRRTARRPKAGASA